LNMKITFEVQPFSQYWFCQSMSMESLSIFCNDFDFFLQWFIVFIVEFFHFLCLVILMYSIFGNIVNRIISYILSQFVTYWYTETLLIFVNWICPTTLLRLFMMSVMFLVEFSVSFRDKIMSSANRGIFTSPFPIWTPFIFSSFL
jgi:hypothetical protein